ncbi:MAG TPA: hypothetical protein DCS67_10925 [Clostridiales bacterium UBA8960]|nr:hypothetical protein [Clostridiales bacterium UBA8960]
MNLQQFKSWKLLYEDLDLCFSRAVYEMDKVNVFFITFFKPENLAIATKHMIEAHLNNYMALIEDDGKLHLVLREQKGHPIRKFIAKSALSYDDRIQIAYSYLKQIAKYDDFPDAIKIQLLDDEQCLIHDDGLSFRELVDYTLSQKYTYKDVLKQVGITLDMILHDAEGYHSQFIDNLIIGNHTLDSLATLKAHFKDIFIFEKPEAFETIRSEYTIILNDLEAGPPLKFYDAASHAKIQPIHELPQEEIMPETLSEIKSDDLLHEDLQRELANLLIVPSEVTVESSEPIEEPIEEPIAEQVVQTHVDPISQSTSEPLDEATITHTKSFKAIFEEEDQLPESLPKSNKQRILDEDDDLFDDDMSQMFDEDELLHEKKRIPKWLILSGVALIIVVLSVIGFSQLFNSEPVNAKFVIEPLRDDRIAFMNTSTGEKRIDAYAWEIYYADTLIQTFTDKNLFPVFDTEGEYKIVLKVKDNEGNWSEPYSEVYKYDAKED